LRKQNTGFLNLLLNIFIKLQNNKLITFSIQHPGKL
jgi:hypothetical protein